MPMPPIRYADNNSVFIAYRTVGEGDEVTMTSKLRRHCRVTQVDLGERLERAQASI